jgi:hypothetical protein
MVAGALVVGERLIPECGCIFTAEGRTDTEYPQHLIFRHTQQCGDGMCRWRGTPYLWFFDDEPINRPGNVVLQVQRLWDL